MQYHLIAQFCAIKIASKEDISQELEAVLRGRANHNYEGFINSSSELLTAYDEGVIEIETTAIEIAETSTEADTSDTLQQQPLPAEKDIKDVNPSHAGKQVNEVGHASDSGKDVPEWKEFRRQEDRFEEFGRDDAGGSGGWKGGLKRLEGWLGV